jgi:exosortase
LDTNFKKSGSVWVAGAVCVASFLWVYRGVLQGLVFDWQHDANYAHGFFIAPLAAYFAWERRRHLAAIAPRGSVLGLIVLAAGLGVLLLGVLGAELFLTRVSILLTLAGTILFIWGYPRLKALAFPLAFLLLMIPLPAIVFNQIAFPLQLVASRAGELTLSAAGIPVLREGNVIILATTSLEVAEACSGIRSLITLLTLGIVYGYFIDPRPSVRVLIALATIPVAILANAFRVAGTGFAAHFYGAGAAEGFFHTFSGWLVFVAAFSMLFAIARVVVFLIPRKPLSTQAPAMAT